MKRISLVLTSLLLLACATSAWADLSDQEFEKAIEKYLGTDKGQVALGAAVEKYFQKKQQEAGKKREEQMAAEMENQFKNPVNIAAGSSPVRGPAGAKVTIIEFSDFQCPFCKRGKDTMEQVMKKYPNDVKVVFKNLPLPMHPEANPAARAALAAGKQGKFWEMHDALFDNQGSLGTDFYTDQAKKLGLDVDKFKKDMDAPDIAAAIKADSDLAQQNGISGTPGFFVNGVAVKGAYPPDHFGMIIDRWLNGGAAPKKS